MKKFLFLVSMVFSLHAICLAGPTIPVSLEKSFQQTYPAAEHQTWFALEKGYKVYFDNGKAKCEIEYDEQGKFVRSTRYYGVGELPPLISEGLYDKWKERTVFGVVEVTNDGDLKYVITLEDKNHWYKVESDAEGHFMQTEKWNKA